MEEKICRNIREERLRQHLTLQQLAKMIGKSESCTQAYESGEVDIKLSVLVKIAEVLQVPLDQLVTGNHGESQKGEDGVALRIYQQDDRLKTAEILIKNGYKVSQYKSQREGSKTVDYWLMVETVDKPLDSSR